MVQTTGNGDILVKIDGDDSGLKSASERSAAHLQKMEDRAQRTAAVMDKLKGVMVGLGAALGTAALISYADSWSELNSRVNNAAGSMEKGRAVMDRLQEMARRTYSSVKQTTEAFLGQSTTMKALGYSTETQLNVTEALNNALVISATKGDRAAAVMKAWGDAMALGKLSGDQLNTVMLGSDRLAQALADSLGVGVDQLRKMGADGKITTEQMMKITGELEKLRTEAEEMPATMGDAMSIWNDALLVVIGTVDQATGISQGMATSMVELADKFRESADVAATFAIMVQTAVGDAISYVTGLFSSLGSESDRANALIVAGAAAGAAAMTMLASVMATQVVGAIRAVTAAMMANPIGLFVAAVAAAITAAYLFRDEIKQAIGVDALGVMKDFGNGTIAVIATAFTAIKEIWNNLPAIITEIGNRMANGFIAGVEYMVNMAIRGFGKIIDAANSLASFFGADYVAQTFGWGTGQFSKPMEIEFDRIKSSAEGTMADVNTSIKNAFTENNAKNYLGDLTGGLNDMWKSAAAANEEAKSLMATLDGEDDPKASPSDDGKGKGKGKGGKGKGGGRADKMRERMANSLEALREGLATEEEAEIMHYEKQLEELKKYWDARMITEEEYHAMLEAAKEKHEEKLVDIRKKAMQKEQQARSEMTGYVKGTLQAISQTMDSEGDKQIGIQKAISLAIAAINVAEGITKALTLPFPLNLAAAAQTAAQGMAAIASINSTQRGNTGSLGGGSGTSGIDQAASTQNETQQSIYIQGIDRNSFYTGDAIMQILDGINDAVNNGAVIRTQPK